jgi:type II secretory pathway predicted ATPase ExeA
MKSKSNGSDNNDVRSHFHLHAMPFTREFPIHQRWRHPLLDEAAAELRSTVEQRMSGAVFSASGNGKTVVLRALRDALPEARYRVHYIKVTDLGKRDFCKQLAVALGLPPAGCYGSLVNKVQSRCQGLLDEDSLRPVLLLDEAHDFRADVLAIMRILTNFEMDSRLVVSVVFAGQARLRALLKRNELESVSSRIAQYCSLRLFSRDEIRQYVQHRCEMAGAKSELFDNAALDALYECAQGNLRATDSLALKSLEIATAENCSVTGAEHVARARTKVLP